MNYTELKSYFSHNGERYDLNPIFEIAAKLPIQSLPIGVVHPGIDLTTADPQRVEQADISVPLILMSTETGYILVDGLHRLAKLTTLGIRKVTCVVMPERWFKEGYLAATTATKWFSLGCANQRYLFKGWVIRMLSVTELPESYPDSPIKDPQYLEDNAGAGAINNWDFWPVKRNGVIGFVHTANNEFFECVDIKDNQAIVSVNDVIALNAGSVPNLTKDTVTLIGNLLFNYVALVYAFGAKIPFQTGKVKIPRLEKMIVDRLVDDAIDPSQESSEFIYVRELKKYLKAMSAMAGYATLCVPAATPRTLLPHPDAKALRIKLINQYKDQLHDPAKVAIITKALEELDRQWNAEDPDGGFYQSNKQFEVIRMKMYGIYGMEQNFRDGGYTLIEKPLIDGWDLTKLPAMADALRDGSYNRGAETALGGYEVKTILRTMSGSVISQPDCGVSWGMDWVLTQDVIDSFIGHTIVLDDLTQVKLTVENKGGYVGRAVQVRTPAFCRTGNNNFCLTCFGDFIKDKQQALGVVASELGSRLLLLFMKKMHGSALKTVKYDMIKRIS